MRTIKVKPNQTLFDIAIEQYGTIEATSELLTLNPNITNDPRSKVDADIDYVSDTDFYINLAVLEGSMVTVNPDSELRQSTTLRELHGTEITTYNNGENY